MTMTEATTRTLEVPGAELAYDVRSGGSAHAPVLFMIGSPMAAAGFGTLAGHFADRTIMTYDPRGSERSEMTDPASSITPDVQADDLHRLIHALGAGPVDLFASSGGAVNALALVARHPEDVRTLVAHEPPLASILPDRDAALAACRAIHDTYQRSGWGAGMAHFIAVVSHKGLMTDEIAGQPGPDPAMFGMPAEDDGSRTDPISGRASSPRPTTSPTSTPYGRRRPGSSWLRARGRRARWPTEAHTLSLSGSGSKQSSSRAITAASWAASTARQATLMPLPRSCARSCPRAEREAPATQSLRAAELETLHPIEVANVPGDEREPMLERRGCDEGIRQAEGTSSSNTAGTGRCVASVQAASWSFTEQP